MTASATCDTCGATVVAGTCTGVPLHLVVLFGRLRRVSK